jgi:Uma2 family endonuclease
MTQAKPRFLTFEEYLEYEDNSEGRYELIDGELVELPPESEPNASIANYLFLRLVNAGIPFRLVHVGKCEIQVSVLQKGDAANRYPDLIVLDEIHLSLTQKRLTITVDMLPPRLVAEVLSPGKADRERDLIQKRDQYANRGIPEYWLIDPREHVLTVLRLEAEQYVEVGAFRGNDRIQSPTFSNLDLTPAQIFQAVQ